MRTFGLFIKKKIVLLLLLDLSSGIRNGLKKREQPCLWTHIQTSQVAFFQSINQKVPLQGTSGIVVKQRHPLSA